MNLPADSNKTKGILKEKVREKKTQGSQFNMIMMEVF